MGPPWRASRSTWAPAGCLWPLFHLSGSVFRCSFDRFWGPWVALGTLVGSLWGGLGCLGLPLRSFGLSSRPFDRFWGPWVALWTPFGRPGAATVSPSTLLGSLRTSLGPLVGPCGLSLDSFRFLGVPLGFPCGFLDALPGLASAPFWLWVFLLCFLALRCRRFTCLS